MHVKKRRWKRCGRVPGPRAAAARMACTAMSPGRRTWSSSASPGRCRRTGTSGRLKICDSWWEADTDMKGSEALYKGQRSEVITTPFKKGSHNVCQEKHFEIRCLSSSGQFQ